MRAVLVILALLAISIPSLAQQSPPLGTEYPNQGTNCNGNSLSPTERTRAALSCLGVATVPLNVFGECFYVDNSSSNVYFIPLQTQQEWVAFRAAVQSGNLAGLTLRACGAPVNGACGSAHGKSASRAPTANLCSVGSASAVSGTGPWSWSCAGSDGGTSASCATAAAFDPCDGEQRDNCCWDAEYSRYVPPGTTVWKQRIPYGRVPHYCCEGGILASQHPTRTACP